jgi:hypothetical protein
VASDLKRIGDLEINQDMDFQRRCWKVQRIGWTIMVLLILGGLFGLFGRGPFSRTLTSDPSIPLSLEYERFGRYQSRLTLSLHVSPGASEDGKVRLWFSQDFLSRVQIQGITPHPDGTELSSSGTTYIFTLAEPNQGGDVIVHGEAQAIGLLSGKVGLSESRSIPFTQWIYP